MRAVHFENITPGTSILVNLKDLSGANNFTVLKVLEIDQEDYSVVTNLNGGINVSPNEDNQYIVIE